jgi:hypothetical protein
MDEKPTYRERRERRAERLRDWAEKRDAKASAARGTADSIMDAIPLGQPILVGHHSQRRHERAIVKLDNATRASAEHNAKASEFRRRADNIAAAADRAIYDDDPDAPERLRERIAELEAERDRIKAAARPPRAAKQAISPSSTTRSAPTLRRSRPSRRSSSAPAARSRHTSSRT